MQIPPELAVICFGCPHLKKKGGLRCEQSIGACHSKKVKAWRKGNKEGGDISANK